MTATRKDISEWFDEGVRQGMQHMLVMHDTFDHENYPKFVPVGQDPRAYDPHGANMQKVDECYILDPAKKAEQMGQFRAFRWDDRLP